MLCYSTGTAAIEYFTNVGIGNSKDNINLSTRTVLVILPQTTFGINSKNESPFRRDLSWLSALLHVPSKSGFLPDGCFSDLLFKMLNNGKSTAFLSILFQDSVSVSAPYLIILTFKTCVLQ